MSEAYYNTDHFEKYNSKIFIFPVIGISLVVWCIIIYFLIIIPKETISWFEKIVLAFPFIYIFFFFFPLYNGFFGGPELNVGCMKFENKKQSTEGIIGKWYWECSMQQVFAIAYWLKVQTENISNLTYGLLLLMLVTTSFKRNMLDIPIIKSFSVVLMIITTIILFNLQFGLMGSAAAFLVVLNGILTAMGISSFLIVLLNLHRLK